MKLRLILVAYLKKKKKEGKKKKKKDRYQDKRSTGSESLENNKSTKFQEHHSLHSQGNNVSAELIQNSCSPQLPH